MRKSDLERIVKILSKKTFLILIIIVLGALTILGMATNFAIGIAFMILLIIAISTLLKTKQIEEFFDKIFKGGEK